MNWNKELDFYDSLIEACDGFERKGKTMIYTSSNGYMISLLNKAGEFGILLPKDVAAKFMKDYHTGFYYSYGAKMKDYELIGVPHAVVIGKKLADGVVEFMSRDGMVKEEMSVDTIADFLAERF